MFKRLKIKPKQSYKTIDGTSGKGVLRDKYKKMFEFYINSLCFLNFSCVGFIMGTMTNTPGSGCRRQPDPTQCYYYSLYNNISDCDDVIYYLYAGYRLVFIKTQTVFFQLFD